MIMTEDYDNHSDVQYPQVILPNVTITIEAENIEVEYDSYELISTADIDSAVSQFKHLLLYMKHQLNEFSGDPVILDPKTTQEEFIPDQSLG